MMTVTHMAIGCLFVAVGLQSADPTLLAIGAIASLLPDVDLSQSVAGRVLPFVSNFLESRLAHRSATHSIVASLILAIATYPLAIAGLIPVNLIHAFNIGYFAGWFADMFTKSGIELFWPQPGRWVCPGNRNLRISTGSNTEYILLTFLAALTLMIFYANTQGGLMTQFNHLVATTNGVEQLYNQDGADWIITVHVEGVRAIDRQPINADYQLIEAKNKSFIIRDKQGGLYKVGANDQPDVQIISERINGKPAQKASTLIKNITLQDEAIAPVLNNLASLNSNAQIYLSGTIKIDDPQDLIVENKPGQLPIIDKKDSTIILESAPIDQVINVLDSQWAIGQLTARIIYIKD